MDDDLDVAWQEAQRLARSHSGTMPGYLVDPKHQRWAELSDVLRKQERWRVGNIVGTWGSLPQEAKQSATAARAKWSKLVMESVAWPLSLGFVRFPLGGIPALATEVFGEPANAGHLSRTITAWEELGIINVFYGKRPGGGGGRRPKSGLQIPLVTDALLYLADRRHDWMNGRSMHVRSHGRPTADPPVTDDQFVDLLVLSAALGSPALCVSPNQAKAATDIAVLRRGLTTAVRLSGD